MMKQYLDSSKLREYVIWSNCQTYRGRRFQIYETVIDRALELCDKPENETVIVYSISFGKEIDFDDMHAVFEKIRKN